MKKYISPLTAKLTPDTWQDQVNLKSMSLDEVTDLLGDFKAMKSFANQMEGYFKEAAKAKMPEGETEYVGTHFMFELVERSRAGGLDKDIIMEEMGASWFEDHCKEPTEYMELRMKRVEEDA